MPYPRNHVVALGDIDGNRTLDVFAGSYGHHYRVWYNDGTGHFGRHKGMTCYWLAGGLVVTGLGVLCWWAIRRRQQIGPSASTVEE
jgi:hypothetical protein